MTEYYVGTLEECQSYDAIITANCGWPSGGTTNWDNPKETAIPGVYAIEVPQGSHGFTKEQMNAGISSAITVDPEFPEAEII